MKDGEGMGRKVLGTGGKKGNGKKGKWIRPHSIYPTALQNLNVIMNHIIKK